MLDDHAQIGQVLIRYATGIDRKDWPLLRTCWTDDVVVDYDTLGQYTCADKLTEVMKQTHENMGPTYHRLSNFVIDVDGDRAAVAPTYTPSPDHSRRSFELARCRGPLRRRVRAGPGGMADQPARIAGSTAAHGRRLAKSLVSGVGVTA